MIGQTLGMDGNGLALAVIGLFLFGCAYALFVYWLGERKVGYVSLFVVLGAGVTLGAEAMLDSRAALLSLVLFAASGTPMIAGEIIQHIGARERAIREHQARAGDAIREMSGDGD